MNEFAELAPKLPDQTYAELHRDPVTGGLTFIEASPVDNNSLYATETGYHSMLDELRSMYGGQLPPEYLFADGLNTETVTAKGMVEQTPEGPVLHINHFRNKGDKTEQELLAEVNAAASDTGIAKVLFEQQEPYQPVAAEMSASEAQVPVDTHVSQLPATAIPDQVYSKEVDSGVVTGLRYEQDESGRFRGILETLQAHAITHQPVLEAAGFNGFGMAPRNKPVLFTRNGEPVMGGLRYVVDDKNHLFTVSLTSPRGVNNERKTEVLQTAARALYDELGLDPSYRQLFTIGDARNTEEINPARIMGRHSKTTNTSHTD